MVLSDHIAAMIEKMLEDGGGSAEVRRNDLAQKIGCVPSQISYVITSRFTPERGYVTDSRRGGGGCIRIVRVQMSRNEYLMHFFQAVGKSVGEKEAAAYLRNLTDHGIMTEREARLAAQAMSSAALENCPAEKRDALRAEIFRRMLMIYMM
jgi:transcriptional regulator CtsR